MQSEAEHRARSLAALLLLAGLALRVLLALRPGLWVDEVFSLAMATGHSLEHPARAADPVQGDFVEAPGPRSAREFAGYVAHEAPPAHAARVIRAVKLSDTNPPLYYLLLGGWLGAAGTSDAALRLFSVAAALACFPLVFWIGRSLGGSTTALAAAALFAFSPPALYYASEGRMYALGWLLGLGLVATTLELARRGPSPLLLALWVASAASGSLVHYFFVFLEVACASWLLLHPGRLARRWTLAAAALAAALALPWYAQVPETLGAWRVTAGWLDQPLDLAQALVAPLRLGWSFLSGYWVWGGSLPADSAALALLGGAALFALRRGARALGTPAVQLVGLCALAACTGPLAFDLVRGSSASLYPRYAALGLPMGILLAGLLVAQLPRLAQAAFVAALVAAWSPGLRALFLEPSRPAHRLPELAERLAGWRAPGDLVIVHSIPSGVIGVARYLEPDTPVLSWVEQLGRRDPRELEGWLAGRCRVAFVRVHGLGEPAPALDWLRAHASPRGDEEIASRAEIFYFDLAAGDGSRARRCPKGSEPGPRSP
jgi:4-amino-4-deoxy-L-arabinose transferase-like glycosyltransferase